MRNETKLATVENIVTALCFGVGALLVVLAIYTLMAVKTVRAEIPMGFSVGFASTGPGGSSDRADEPGTFATMKFEEASVPR